MSNKKKILGIITLIMAAILIVFTCKFMFTEVAPVAEELGGADSEAYKTALKAYSAQQAYLTIGALIVGAFMFVTEVIPIAVTAMFLPVYFSASGILTYGKAFSGLSNSTVVLFGGMFVVGAAMFETGLAQRIGISVVKLAAGSETKMLLGIMLVTGTMSAFLSNTGTVAVLMPVCIGIADSQGWSRSRVLMPLAIMASAGGMITMVGTPPNLTVNAVLENAGVEGLGFFGYAWFGIPVSIVTIIYCMTVGRKLIPDRTPSTGVTEDAELQKEKSPQKQLLSGIILVIVIIMMAAGWVDLAIVAVAGALVCIVTGCLSAKDAVRGIDWSTIFLFAGALSLAEALAITGAGKIVADQVVNLMGGNPNPYVLFTVLFFLTGTLTQFMSNTAAAALLCPIGLSIAESVGADPVAVVAAIGFAASAAYVTPVATPPNTLVYGPAGFKFMDYVKVGGPLFILTYIVAIIIIPIVWPFF